jgi:hypothetical protein
MTLDEQGRESMDDEGRERAAGANIVSVEARTVRVPLDQATSFSTRRVTARDYALVRVRTADGSQGIG